MNSLTSVNGHIIESEELNSMQDRLSRTGTTSPRNGSVRMKSPRGQQLTWDPNMRPSSSTSSPSSSSPGNVSPVVAKAKLSRQSNALPPTIDTSTDYEGNKKIITIPIRPPDLRLPPRSPPPRSPRFKKNKFNTPSSSFSPSSPSSAPAHHDNSHIIHLLETLSKQESFHTSSYFRGVFTRGIDKVRQHTHYKLTTVEEALELCFDVSDDMRKVIATKVHADEMMMTAMMGGSTVVESSEDIDSSRGDNNSNNSNSYDNRINKTHVSSSNNNKARTWDYDNSDNNNDRNNVNSNSNRTNVSNSNSNKARAWDTSPRANTEEKKLRPWEIDGAKNNRRPSVQEYMQQIEERIQLTYYGGPQSTFGHPRKETVVENQPSVMRANAALEVAVENEKKIRSPFDEALVSPRFVRRKGEDRNDALPLMDEALVSPRLVRRKGMMSPFQDFDEEVEVETRSRSVVAHGKKEMFAASEHLVKELELLDDKKRISLELEKSKTDLDRQKHEAETVKNALDEAKLAVQTLEATVRDLKKATKEKDEKIDKLESKVKLEEIASAGSQEAHQEQVKELATAVAQLNMLVKKMEDESKEADARLAEAVEKYNKSEEVLKMLQVTMTERDEEQAAIIQELENERDDLVRELESCKETMTTSLDNTTKQMDAITKEKDKLIYSLSAKIELLEANLDDLKARKLEVEVSAADNEKELNEKIHELATALTEKDEKMTTLEKEINDLKLSTKKEKKRSEKQERRHTTKHRPREDQDLDSRRSSFESKEERSRRQRSRSRHRRRSHDDDLREDRPHKAERVPTRSRYSTPEPEPYYEDERDDGYNRYPEREGALFSPIDDDSYIYRRHM